MLLHFNQPIGCVLTAAGPQRLGVGSTRRGVWTDPRVTCSENHLYSVFHFLMCENKEN